MPTFKDNMKSMFGMLKKPETKESHSADADTKTKAIDPLNNKNSLITNSNINNSNSPMVKPTSSKKCELIAANVPIEKENADKKKTTQFAPKQIVNKSRDTIKNYDLYKYEYYSAQPIFDHLSPIFSNNIKLKNQIQLIIVLMGGQAILLHFKDEKMSFSFMKLNSLIFGIRLIISIPKENLKNLNIQIEITNFPPIHFKNGNEVFKVLTFENFEIIKFLKEYNLQILKINNNNFKFNLLPLNFEKIYPRFYITIYGISSLIPKQNLISIFRRLGDLISFSFAPVGLLTKYHIINLQYSRFINKFNLIYNINSIFKNYKIKIKVKVNFPKQIEPNNIINEKIKSDGMKKTVQSRKIATIENKPLSNEKENSKPETNSTPKSKINKQNKTVKTKSQAKKTKKS
ncbi:uncharacterized protein KGF55_005659 [Candida pseudojiufengensis]|uniref:uncharacterized protein n=1 Tax=Candida pseudojiufengensis TaxID=497109 RepID=UPI002223F1B3|nr:uncharacterized protein KGF55_005659 [Candida pseudojiufengensis]KAI5959005.1 hypothetical protein KGF55_005659 [Candida pseudojiufengensis]